MRKISAIVGSRVIGVIGVVGVVALLAGACSGDSSDSSVTELSSPDGFRSDAARLCTEIANESLGAPMRGTVESSIEIFEFRQNRTLPSDADFQRWIDDLGPVHDRVAAAVDSARTVSSEDAAEQEAWDTVVEGGAAYSEFLAGRLEALRNGDIDAYEVAQPDSGKVERALERLDLSQSDCVVMFEPPEVTETDREFVISATTACTGIGIRRLDSGFEDDTFRVVQAIGAVQSGDTDLPPEVVDAVKRIVPEWQATVEDLEAVDAASAPEGWSQILDAARERLTVAERRLEVAENPTAVAVSDLFRPGLYQQVGFEFESVGLGARSCGMVTG